jgi:uncharacterized membrane protein YhaH (DUF805 family)
MKAAIIDGYKRWNDYSGRTSRSQFWWFYLFVLITPYITLSISLLFSFIFSLLDLDFLSNLSIVISFLFLINIPVFIAVGVRRMHDVGKSGWFILVPLYNLYLYVQPAVEKGRIPNWILAERIALGFVGILIVSVISSLFGRDVDSFSSLIFWLVIYFLIRRKNQSNKKIEGQ